MKKFLFNGLYKLTIYSTFTFIIVVLIAYLKYNFTYVYDQYNKDLKSISDIEIGFFGDSQIQGGLDYETIQNNLNKVTFQFAEGGNTLYSSTLLIDRILSKNPSMIVVLDLGSNNTPYNGTFNHLQGDLYNLSAYKSFIANNQYLFNYDLYKTFIKINPTETFQSIIKGSFFNMAFFMYEGKDMNPPTFTEKYDQSFKNWKKIASEASSKNHILDKNFEYDLLIKIIKKHSKTNFILVRPPETIYLRTILNLDEFEIIKSKVLKFNNVTFLDYADFEMKYEEDFSDLSHLSSNGMNKFTIEFQAYLLNYLNINK